MMLVLALAPSSFGQVNIQAIGIPSEQEITTNRTAQTGDPRSSGSGILISGSAFATAPVTQTSLFLDFPSVVTSSGITTASPGGPLIPDDDPVRIEGLSGGLFVGVAISSINFSTGVIEITLPGCQPPPAAPGTGCVTPTVGAANGTGSFRVVGVRIDANGVTAPVDAAISLSSASNNYILTSSSARVINSVGPGIGSIAIGSRSGANAGTGTILTTGAASDPSGTLVIGEGFASAWRTSVQSSTQSLGPTENGTGVRLTFAGIPTGVSITLTTTNSSPTLGTPTLTNATITGANSTTTIDFPTTSLTTTETVQLNMTFSGTATPPAAGAITVTGTMVPIGAALGGNLQPLQSDGYPKFAQADVGPVTVGNIVAATTTLLVPFAVRDLGFDTGISLANTTADPFGPSGGGATPSSGTVRLDFFPRAATGGAGTAFSLTTSATARPGIGLSADGTLAAGATWTVLLSELLTAAGQTGSFTGYMFITTNFLNAHGAPFVSDFRNFTSFTPMLVLPPPISAGRTGGTNGFESLSF
jgi:hypothetical protein